MQPEVDPKLDMLDAPRDLWDRVEIEALKRFQYVNNAKFKAAQRENPSTADTRIYADDVHGALTLSDEQKDESRKLIKEVIKDDIALAKTADALKESQEEIAKYSIAEGEEELVAVEDTDIAVGDGGVPVGDGGLPHHISPIMVHCRPGDEKSRIGMKSVLYKRNHETVGDGDEAVMSVSLHFTSLHFTSLGWEQLYHLTIAATSATVTRFTIQTPSLVMEVAHRYCTNPQIHRHSRRYCQLGGRRSRRRHQSSRSMPFRHRADFLPLVMSRPRHEARHSQPSVHESAQWERHPRSLLPRPREPTSRASSLRHARLVNDL